MTSLPDSLPWILVYVLTYLVMVVFLAYARAAKERDVLRGTYETRRQRMRRQ